MGCDPAERRQRPTFSRTEIEHCTWRALTTELEQADDLRWYLPGAYHDPERLEGLGRVDEPAQVIDCVRLPAQVSCGERNEHWAERKPKRFQAEEKRVVLAPTGLDPVDDRIHERTPSGRGAAGLAPRDF